MHCLRRTARAPIAEGQCIRAKISHQFDGRHFSCVCVWCFRTCRISKQFIVFFQQLFFFYCVLLYVILYICLVYVHSMIVFCVVCAMVFLLPTHWSGERIVPPR